MTGKSSAILLTLVSMLSLGGGPLYAQQAPTVGGAVAAAGGDGGGPRHGAGLGFGQMFLAGDINTNFSSGLGFNFNYAYESGSRFGLLVNIHWSNHSNPESADDSLSLRGLMPNLKINLMTYDKLTLAVFGGLGAFSISQTVATRSAGVTVFAMQAGAALNVDVTPRFRFGPSLSVVKLSTGTDSASASSSSSSSTTSVSSMGPVITIGGTLFEMLFTAMYFF